MDRQKLEERFRFLNPWWASGQVPAVLSPGFRRHIFSKLVSYLTLDRIIILKGPRRTGKSTLFYQLINYLLKERAVKAKDIIYLTFDDPSLRIDLFEIMKVYEQISSLPFSQTTTKYIFLDEVQFLPDWASMVKLFFDRKLPVKLFVSGSAASLLIKQSESLAGRTVEEILLPLSFSEWVEYYRNTPVLFGNSNEIAFRQYLSKSGFMHLLNIEEKEIWTRMLVEDVVTKAVYKDSVEIFGLREPAILEKLFAYLSSVTGGLVNLVKLSSMLGVDRIQAGKYLHFLQNTLLIFPLHKYSRKVRETVRSQEKMHLIDQGFCEVYQTEKGAKLESVVARHVWERYPKDTYFWRDKTEVDIVIDLKKSLLPLEVKNSSSLGKQDLSGLVSFCKKFRQKHALVIYNGRKQSQKLAGIRIEFYPVWDFLLEES